MDYNGCPCMGAPSCTECLYAMHLSGEYLELDEVAQLMEDGYIINESYEDNING